MSSPNTAWRSEGFRGYADHTTTRSFQAALERVIERAEATRTGIMCAEALPWRCHRQLIADQLVARRITVIHILGAGRHEQHALNPQAWRLPDGKLVYPAEGPQTSLFSA